MVTQLLLYFCVRVYWVASLSSCGVKWVKVKNYRWIWKKFIKWHARTKLTNECVGGRCPIIIRYTVASHPQPRRKLGFDKCDQGLIRVCASQSVNVPDGQMCKVSMVHLMMHGFRFSGQFVRSMETSQSSCCCRAHVCSPSYVCRHSHIDWDAHGVIIRALHNMPVHHESISSHQT